MGKGFKETMTYGVYDLWKGMTASPEPVAPQAETKYQEYNPLKGQETSGDGSPSLLRKKTVANKNSLLTPKSKGETQLTNKQSLLG